MRDVREIDGADPLDARLGGGTVSPTRWAWHRPALGLAPTPVPSSAVLLAGVALGPHGLGVLTPDILRSAEPAITAAVVALGVLIGLGAGTVRAGVAPRFAIGAAVEAGITFVVVALAFIGLGRVTPGEWMVPPWLPWLLGISAASSATRIHADGDTSDSARLGELDDVVPLVAAAIVLAVAAGGLTVHAALLLGASVGLAVGIAAAGWFLVSSAGSEGEQHVFAAGSVLLLAGVATSLSASPLFVGGLAAVAWSLSGAAGREPLVRDLRYLQHPLVVFVLLLAGASAQITERVLVMAGLFALARLAAKLTGGAFVAPLVPGMSRWLGLHLVAPGAAGIAAALMVVHATGLDTAAAPFLGIAVCGAIVSDLLAVFLARGDVVA